MKERYLKYLPVINGTPRCFTEMKKWELLKEVIDKKGTRCKDKLKQTVLVNHSDKEALNNKKNKINNSSKDPNKNL
jgi:hypothetical protein